MEDILSLEKYLSDSKKYFDKNDYDNSLKCAMMSVTCTDTPRADVCCCIGDIYMSKSHFKWAEFWFERALGNVWVGENGETIDESFSTTIPMLRLSYLAFLDKNLDKAKMFCESVLKIDPKNEDALYNKGIFEKL